jgi:hypothetical protein
MALGWCGWKRTLVSLNILWNSDVLGKVIKKRRMFTVAVASAGDRRVVDICLTLIKSNQGSPIHLRCPLQKLRMEEPV